MQKKRDPCLEKKEIQENKRKKKYKRAKLRCILDYT